MPNLADAIVLAAKAHGVTVDKSGEEPYLLHPLRVMLRLKAEPERIVGVLHDVVEDTRVTLDDLRREGYSEEIVAAVNAISQRKAQGESYEDYLDRVAANPLARKVKLADLADNMSDAREKGRTPRMMAKFRLGWARLTGEDASE